MVNHRIQMLQKSLVDLEEVLKKYLLTKAHLEIENLERDIEGMSIYGNTGSSNPGL